LWGFISALQKADYTSLWVISAHDLPKRNRARKSSPLSAICGWSSCPSLFSYPSDQLFYWLRQNIACCTLVEVLPGWKLLCLLYIEIEVKKGRKHIPKADLNDPGNSVDLKLETGKFPLQASHIKMASHVHVTCSATMGHLRSNSVSCFIKA